MNSKRFVFLIALLCIGMSSCINDSDKNEKEYLSEKNKDTINEDIKKPLLNNIYSRVKATDELSLLEMILDSLQLNTSLIYDQGPFTVFAVKDEVFHSFLKEDSLFLAIKENKEEWTQIMSTYILNDRISSVNLYQNIKKNGGVFHAKTSSGKHLKFYLIENDIIVEGPKGLTSKIGKSDILGSNGVLHIIDNLIGSH